MADIKATLTSTNTSLSASINQDKRLITKTLASTEVTKAQLGLGLVTNESKATMFNNPTFTGSITGSAAALSTLYVTSDGSSDGKVTADALTVNAFDVAASGGGVSYNGSAFTVDTVGQLTASHSVAAPNGYFTTVGGTLSTAAQPNITSVGTLTALVMGGTLNMGGQDITGGDTISANAVSAATLAGTLSTAAQTGITSVGTLAGLTVSADVNMNGQNIVSGNTITASTVSAGTLSGTISNAAQTNITSVGTLTSLTVSTDGSSDGKVTCDALDADAFKVTGSGGGISYNTTAFTVDTNGDTALRNITSSGDISATGSITADANLAATGVVTINDSPGIDLIGNFGYSLNVGPTSGQTAASIGIIGNGLASLTMASSFGANQGGINISKQGALSGNFVNQDSLKLFVNDNTVMTLGYDILDATDRYLVGIGNFYQSMPTEALEVKGNIKADNIIITGAASSSTHAIRKNEFDSHTSNITNPHAVTKAQVGLGNVTNESKATMFTDAALTGNPTAPTQGAADNTTKIATTEYVTTAVGAIVDSAPGSLNTLNELAAALNDSPSQIDNILSAVGQRLVIGNNLSDLNNAATARTNLGLGSAATTDSTAYATAAQGARADSAEAITSNVTVFGSSLVDDVNAAAARTTLELGNVTNESKATMFTDPTFTGSITGTIGTATQPNITTINALEIRETTDSSSYAILGHSSVIPATVGSLQSLGGGYAFASQSLGNTYINKKADRSMYFESGGVTKVKFDSFDNWTFYNGTRVQITNPTGPSEGLRFTHSASGPANDEFNMYYAGSAAGAPFVLNKEGTGNAEIVFFNNGDVNINGGYQGSGSGNSDNNVGIGVNGTTRLPGGGANTAANPTNKLHVYEESGKTMGTFIGSTFGLSKASALVRIEQATGENLFLDGRTIAADNILNLIAESTINIAPSKTLTVGFAQDRMASFRPVRFASYTTTDRNNLTPNNGDVIYNSTDDKFQGYAGGAWVNLH